MNHTFFLNAGRRFWARAALALVFCAALVMPTIFATAASSVPTVDIDIAKFAYGPKEITIAPGTKVIWTNHDETPHTVTSNDKSFGISMPPTTFPLR